MKTNAQPQVDVFAEIGARQAAESNARLITPEPIPVPKTVLPMKGDARARTFRPIRTVDSPAALEKELARLRKRHAPFLENHAPALANTRITVPIETFDWRIETEADRENFAGTLTGSGSWERVTIPHYGPPLGRAVTYYRTAFDVSEEMLRKGVVFVRFKGVDYQAHVFVNGSLAGSHEGFFAPFEFDVTALVHAGSNTLLVKVENDAICMGNTSWGDDGHKYEGDKIYAATGPGYDDPQVGWHHCPPGMGIYQDVCVEARAPLFIHDIFIRPIPEEGRVEAWVEVWSTGLERTDGSISFSLFGQNFKATLFRDREFAFRELGPRVNYLRYNLELPKPRLWEPDTPWLYQMQVTVRDRAGTVLDCRARQFGMRTFTISETSEPKGRLYLNGREIRLRGANTMGYEQLTVMKKDWNRLIDDVLLAKACNMNFLRLTQRPVQDEIYEYCDRLGLMLQSDLPLFAYMRRNQFAEGVRQAGEMERLVRAHPCNILVTYINEPFGGIGKAHRHLSRPELESFFRACSEAVRLENPDRAIKPVDGDYNPPAEGLPDNHCYCCWYNNHGLSVGRLHKGYWQRVKPGWMYACGEFGAEGLDYADLMRRRYPAAWMPQSPDEERDWTPERIIRAQTGRFHYIWFDTQHTVEDWVRVSHAHQAWATRLMTEAFRRDARMVSCAIHLFIDAFPSGWMKTIMDMERRPKPAFFAYREALTPLMANLRADRLSYCSGETAELEAWICNDRADTGGVAALAYRLEMGRTVLQAGMIRTKAPLCSAECRGRLRFTLPDVAKRTTATVRLALLDGKGHVLHDTACSLDLFPRLPACAVRNVAVIGKKGGAAWTLAGGLGSVPRAWRACGKQPAAILIDDLEAYGKARAAIDAAVRLGATAVLLNPPAGTLDVADAPLECAGCGMGPVHFVSRATGHALVEDFEPNDFRFWHNAETGHESPLMERTLRGDGWTPILASGNGGWSGDWGPSMAAAERRMGDGVFRICSVLLNGRVQTNPVAAIFARRLLQA